jgi:hypothetical protein
MPKRLIKFIALLICFCFLFEQSGFAQIAGELDISGHILQLRNSLIQDKFRPLHLRYLSYDNLNNNFKLLLDKGDLKSLHTQELESSTKTLLNYFFVGISLPNDTFWVNLRPDSANQIIDDYLAKTDVGKILLEADLQLKKDTARFTSPETPEGKEYWDRLYKKAEEIFGSSDITIPTLTRPWIVPDEIIIRETEDNAYIYKATLKVMLEQDYLKASTTYNFKDERLKELNEYSSQLIRELIIPRLTKDVNNARRYAPLRQVYYSLILAQWFKSRFYGKGGLYSRLINKHDLTGIASKEGWSKTTYFKEYQKSFKDGEYNIKTPVYNTTSGQTIRSYFSGGIMLGGKVVSYAIMQGLLQGNPKRDFLERNKRNIIGFELTGRSSPFDITINNISLPKANLDGTAASSAIQKSTSSQIEQKSASSASDSKTDKKHFTMLKSPLFVIRADYRKVRDWGFFSRAARPSKGGTITQMKNRSRLVYYRLLTKYSLEEIVDLSTAGILRSNYLDPFITTTVSSKVVDDFTIKTEEQSNSFVYVIEIPAKTKVIDIREETREGIILIPDYIPFDWTKAAIPIRVWQDVRDIINEYLGSKLGLNKEEELKINQTSEFIKLIYTIYRNGQLQPSQIQQLLEVNPELLDSVKKQFSEIRSQDKSASSAAEQKPAAVLKSQLERTLSLIQDIAKEDSFQEDVRKLREQSRLLWLYDAVASIAKERKSIKRFDLVIYPASGSDVTAGFSYGNNLVTVDRNNLFEVRKEFLALGVKESLREQLKNYIEEKFLSGFHSSRRQVGFVEYTAELVLMGADLDSLQIISDQEISPNLRIVKVIFNVHGERFTHTHFIYNFKEQAMDVATVKHVLDITTTMRRANILLLSKAGSELSGENKWIESINPLLPPGSSIVSDFDWHGAGVRDVTAQVKPVGLGLSEKMNYGYAKSIEGLRFYEKVPATDSLLRQNESTSSAVSGKGGIDFRALPIVTQPMLTTPKVNLSLPALSQWSINLDAEWRQIQNMLNAGIIPSSERIKEYLEASCQSKDCSQRIDNVLSCLADILRLEEEQVALTEPELKQILVLLESDKPANEMQFALSRIKVSPKEPKTIGE